MVSKAPALLTNETAAFSLQSTRRTVDVARDQKFQSALQTASSTARQAHRTEQEDARADTTRKKRKTASKESAEVSTREPPQTTDDVEAGAQQDDAESGAYDNEATQEASDASDNAEQAASQPDATGDVDGDKATKESGQTSHEGETDGSSEQTGGQATETNGTTSSVSNGIAGTVEAALLKALESASPIIRPTPTPTPTPTQPQTPTAASVANVQTNTPASVTSQETLSQTITQQGNAVQLPTSGQSDSQQDGNADSQTPADSRNNPGPVMPALPEDQENTPQVDSESKRPSATSNEGRPAANPQPAKEKPTNDVHAKVLSQRQAEPTEALKPSTSKRPQGANLAVEVARTLTDHVTGPSGKTLLTAGSDPGATEQTNTSTNTMPASTTVGQTVKSPQNVQLLSTTTSGEGANTLGLVQSDDKAGNDAVDRIVRVTQATVGQRTSQVRLQLDPPDLGQVRIDVKVTQGTLSISMQVETEAARDLLHSRFEGLRQGLAQHGLQVGRFEMDVRGSNQAHHNAHDGQPEQQSGQSGDRGAMSHQNNPDHPENSGERPWKETIPREEFGGTSETGETSRLVSGNNVGVDVTA